MSETGLEVTPTSQYPGTRFEPVTHVSNKLVAFELAKKLIAGDLDATIWTSSEILRERVARYKPEIVAADSVSCFDDFGELTNAYDFLALPNRPSKLNDKHKVFLVRGDLTADIPILSKGVYGDAIQSVSETVAPFLEQVAYMPLIYGILAGSIVGIEATVKRGLTRREFLKRSAIIGAGLVGLSLPGIMTIPDINNQSALAKTMADKEFWLKVQEAIRPRVFQNTSVDARTSAVLFKHRDAIDKLGLGESIPGALLFGAHHANEQGRILGSENIASKFIQDHASNMLESLKEISAKTPNFNLPVAQKTLFDFFESYDVLEIAEPESGAKDFSEVVFETRVNRTASPRVAAALASVKQKYQI